MIEISVEKKLSKEVFIEVAGHANYAPRGKDIVCAAISVLYQTMLESIKKNGGNISYGGNNQSQSALIRNPGHDEMLLLDSFLIGCEGVAKAYPYNVKVSRRG